MWDLNYLVFLTEMWVILAIALILADLFFGMNYILLPVGIACLAIAGLVFLKNHDILPQFVALDHWRHVGYWFAGLSVIAVAVLQIYARSNTKDNEDINQY
jgi:membrane protein implicated in regulation of membrane protease activity